MYRNFRTWRILWTWTSLIIKLWMGVDLRHTYEKFPHVCITLIYLIYICISEQERGADSTWTFILSNMQQLQNHGERVVFSRGAKVALLKHAKPWLQNSKTLPPPTFFPSNPSTLPPIATLLGGIAPYQRLGPWLSLPPARGALTSFAIK